MPPLVRSLLLCGCAVLAAVPALAAAESAGAAPPGEFVLPAAGEATEDRNPTTRTVSLTVPLRSNGAYLGDVPVTIDPDDVVRLPAARLADLLAPLLGAEAAQALRSAPRLTEAGLAKAGIVLRYNALELALDVTISGDRLAVRNIEVSPLAPQVVGTFIAPARLSGYLNIRGNLDYLHDGAGGLQAPGTFLDGAARIGDIVVEGEAFWQPGGEGRDLVRNGARLVYDDRDSLTRWTAGDLQPVGRGYQALPDIAGLSVFRTYGVLEPQRIARPRGGRAFTLLRPSTVEVEVNGQVLRRVQLDPGNFDLRDFPFAQGSNDVRVVLVDEAGGREVLNFNVFFDQAQLEPGLTEFGLYAGVLASRGRSGPAYSDRPAVTGFVRRGMSERLTLGGNFQADDRVQMGGAEALWSTRIGTFGALVAASNNRDFGIGTAATLTFQRLDSFAADGGSDSLNLFIERRSANFSILGLETPLNPFSWEAGGSYSRSIGPDLFAGIDGRYSKGRGAQDDVFFSRASLGYRLSDKISLSADVRWERDNVARQVSGWLTATIRLGAYSTLRADYDTRFDRARLSYATFRGQGVGAYNVNADVDRSAAGSAVNVAGTYFGNRAEIGVAHFGNFANTFGPSLAQRSSVRFGTSLAYADGAVSVGRPIFDSFAVVRGHPSLKGASIEVEPGPAGLMARTGALGTAIQPNLAAFLTRTINVEAPASSATADLGQGTFRVLPSYRSGYVLTVGSAYNVSAIGTLVNASGEPLSLVTGTATLLGDTPGPAPITVFTNRQGRFGITGLGPGRWLIRMNDTGSTFVLDIAEDAEGVIKVGELRPELPTEREMR